jgi:hypothetical protein
VNRFVLLLCWGSAFAAMGERINQEGRILGPLPVVTSPLLFNTTNADAVVSAMQILPVTNAWNEDVSGRPPLVNSDAMISQISADLSSTRRSLRVFEEMNFILVPDAEPLVPITFVDYPEESDPSPYPIPANLPIEGWPSQTGTNLFQWQQDTNNQGGDRHAIIVEPGAGYTWETWQTKLLTNGTWQASNGAKFNLMNNSLRPAGWTSADAAGLSMFPALVRYDECERGMVEHACRIVVARSRKEYIYPATHYASTTAATQTNVPAMGQRLRLKAGFVIPSTWAKEEKALLLGLKKYGALVADNGGFFSISITPDDRWSANAFAHISSIGITNFEVVQSTGPNEGPRSSGGPAVNAGSDRAVPVSQPAALGGVVTYSGGPPVVQWKLYSGPAAVTFGNASSANTTATFSSPGSYMLMLSASDGVHAVAYDAVVITVTNAITLAATRGGTNLNLSWNGGAPPFVVERTGNVLGNGWQSVLTTTVQNASVPLSGSNGFFRVRGN